MGSTKKTTKAERELARREAMLAFGGQSEDVAMAALRKMSGSLDGDWDFHEALVDAFGKGWTRLAKAVGSSRALGEDPETLLDLAGRCGREDIFEVAAGFADPHELLRAAYHIHRNRVDELLADELEDLGGRAPMEALAIECARQKLSEGWSRALESGWQTQWKARPQGRYEQACERWSAPVWSASLAEPLAGPRNKLAPGVRWEAHQDQHGSALDLPKEVLLAWGFEFDLWRQAMLKEAPPDPSWPTNLDQAHSSHAWAAQALPRVVAAMEAARSRDAGPAQAKALEAIAAEFVAEGAQRWIPMCLAWANHARYDDQAERSLEPLWKVAILDEQNAGFLAGQWHYGSFNARVARICVGLARHGLASDAAVAILGARIEDLAQDPASRRRLDNSSFEMEIRKLSAEMLAMAQRLEIGSEAALGGLGARSPRL